MGMRRGALIGVHHILVHAHQSLLQLSTYPVLGSGGIWYRMRAVYCKKEETEREPRLVLDERH